MLAALDLLLALGPQRGSSASNDLQLLALVIEAYEKDRWGPSTSPMPLAPSASAWISRGSPSVAWSPSSEAATRVEAFVRHLMGTSDTEGAERVPTALFTIGYEERCIDDLLWVLRVRPGRRPQGSRFNAKTQEGRRAARLAAPSASLHCHPCWRQPADLRWPHDTSARPRAST